MDFRISWNQVVQESFSHLGEPFFARRVSVYFTWRKPFPRAFFDDDRGWVGCLADLWRCCCLGRLLRDFPLRWPPDFEPTRETLRCRLPSGGFVVAIERRSSLRTISLMESSEGTKTSLASISAWLLRVAMRFISACLIQSNLQIIP